MTLLAARVPVTVPEGGHAGVFARQICRWRRYVRTQEDHNSPLLKRFPKVNMRLRDRPDQTVVRQLIVDGGIPFIDRRRECSHLPR